MQYAQPQPPAPTTLPLPWSGDELMRLAHVLSRNGYDPNQLAHVTVRPIRYAVTWEQAEYAHNATPSVVQQQTFPISNTEASLIYGVQASLAADQRWLVGGTWRRHDDPSEFAVPRDALDSITLSAKDSLTTQLATEALPLRQWVTPIPGAYLPAQPFEMILGSSRGDFALELRCPPDLYVRRLTIGIVAIQLIGLRK